jgi:predicted porin
LTLIGEFTVGSGDAEQFTGMSAGAGFPALPAGGGAFAADVDNGLVTYDPSGNGVLHTINWRTFEVGLQYHLPPNGRALLAVNYTQGDSDNAAQLFPKAAGVFHKSQYADVNLFFDVTPAIRLGIGYQYLRQTFCDESTAQNHRFEALGLFFF